MAAFFTLNPISKLKIRKHYKSLNLWNTILLQPAVLTELVKRLQIQSTFQLNSLNTDAC